MKKYIAILLALLMALSLCACSGDGDGKKEQEGERVTVRLLTKSSFTFQYTDTTAQVVIEMEYDADYNPVGSKMYQSGKLCNETTYNKDFDRPLVAQEYDEDGNKTDREESTYDENGNCLTHARYDEDGAEEWKYVYTYDKNGNLLTEKDYSEGELSTETIYTYDDQGNVLTQATDTGDEVIYGTYENVYENGKLKEVKQYLDDTLREYKKYDEDGNVVLDVTYFDGEEESRTEYTYENGKLIKCETFWDGELNGSDVYTYNKDGLLLEHVTDYGNADYGDYRRTYTYEDGVPVKGYTYNGDTMESEAVYTYETVTVTKKQAKNIKKIYEELS